MHQTDFLFVRRAEEALDKALLRSFRLARVAKMEKGINVRVKHNANCHTVSWETWYYGNFALLLGQLRHLL